MHSPLSESHKVVPRGHLPAGPMFEMRRAAEAVVVMVSLELAELAPGVTLLGENAQVTAEGKFEHASETALLNEPPEGVIVTAYVAD